MTKCAQFSCSSFIARFAAYAFTLLLMLGFTIVATPSALAQEFAVLHSFNTLEEGNSPTSAVIMINGNLYGTTQEGGPHRGGTVFELSHQGDGWVESVLYSFNGGQDGALAGSPVSVGPGGLLYGATYAGGPEYGVVYSLRPPARVCTAVQCPWDETVLYRFQGGSDGAHPGNADALVFDAAGNIYGTTEGDANPDGNIGTVWKLSPSNGGWIETVLHRFSGGEQPISGVVFDAAGNLYGTTEAGGRGYGSVYELSPSGSGWTFQAIHEFQNNGDGAYPWGGVVFDPAGNLYGTTENNGGTVFQMQPSNGGWVFNTIYSGFQSNLGPLDTPTLDSAGNIYGTVLNDHGSNAGLVFKLAPSNGSWIETNLVVFEVNGDGAQYPYGSVILDSHGNIYGTTNEGGSEDNGTVWEYTP